MKMVTPLKKAKALGSAKDGTGHFWAQRVSAVALIFLIGWFVYAALAIAPVQYASVVMFLHKPHNVVLLMLLLIATLYHGYLGIQVVIEDYIHDHALKYFLLVFFKLASIVAVVATVFTLFSIYIPG